MQPLEFVVLVLLVGVLYYYVTGMYSDKFQPPYSYNLRDVSDKANCGDNLGEYYHQKYTDRHYYQPRSSDTSDYDALLTHQELQTHEDIWTKKMKAGMDKSYTDAKGMCYQPVNDSGVTTNADVNSPKPYVYNKIDNVNTHEAMSTLNPSDLLPDPCLNKGKDWTNVFSECENLVGGQNFVHFEDEHFTNQVLDTRCTKLQSQDIRKTPAIQYADVSIWNKPSVCKNVFEYIRPSLDGEC